LKKQTEDELKAAGNNTAAVVSNTAAVGNNTAAAVSNTSAVAGNTTTAENTEGSFNKSDIVYRVQLGAFKNKISTSVFNTNAGVLELKSGDNSYRYVTKGFKTIEEAASVRADLVIQGYSDAFVTAYKEGHRIPMNQTKATVDKSYKEDLNENKMFSSVNKKLVTFKVQLGALKKPVAEKSMDERVKDIPNTEKQSTANGSIRYTAGKFSDMAAAEKYRKELEDKGFSDAFIIATFKDQVISIQEALELLK
jgi:cell division septation protein DedD